MGHAHCQCQKESKILYRSTIGILLSYYWHAHYIVSILSFSCRKPLSPKISMKNHLPELRSTVNDNANFCSIKWFPALLGSSCLTRLSRFGCCLLCDTRNFCVTNYPRTFSAICHFVIWRNPNRFLVATVTRHGYLITNPLSNLFCTFFVF